jgi:hypothetical protein
MRVRVARAKVRPNAPPQARRPAARCARAARGTRAFHQGTMVQLALANACEQVPAPSCASVISPVATPAHAGLVTCSAHAVPSAQLVACATTSSRPPRCPASTVSSVAVWSTM